MFRLRFGSGCPLSDVSLQNSLAPVAVSAGTICNHERSKSKSPAPDDRFSVRDEFLLDVQGDVSARFFSVKRRVDDL